MKFTKSALTNLTLFLGLILLTSCKGLTPATSQNSFSYNLTENGCSTGEKIFGSNDAMCVALKDDAYNNYCAQSLRYNKFQNSCPGHTW